MLDTGLTPFSFWICLQVRGSAGRNMFARLFLEHA